MARITEEEWRHLYEHFETTWLFSAVDKVDELPGVLADGEGAQTPEIHDDLLKLHGLAMHVVNKGVTSKAEAFFQLAQGIEFQVEDRIEALVFIQQVFTRLNKLYLDSLADR